MAVVLQILEDSDKEQFIKDNQEAFNYGASHHPDPNDPDKDIPTDEQFPEGMFRFEKRI